MNRALSLFELNSLVREAIEEYVTDEYWVEAELASAHESGGHCYMELIQKEDGSNTPIARASARCWRSTWALLKPHFERETGQTLRGGLKVLLQVYPQFHENFGFSWIVTDIDPTYTLGDMARRRQEIIRRLKEEGVFDLNKELELPLFAQRIAVISSDSAAGYGDFCKQLSENKQGFKFAVELFSAVMQGEQVEQTVIAALNEINERREDFDCVVIIRGGGSTSDLSGFDTLALAENVANFPLPVITGIGHDRDESVLDMVSHTRVKTPTAAAAFLIEHLQDVYSLIVEAEDDVIRCVTDRLQKERLRIDRLIELLPKQLAAFLTAQHARLGRLVELLPRQTAACLTSQRGNLDLLAATMRGVLERRMLQENHRMELLEHRVDAVNPEKLLQRGYSITRSNGRVVRSPEQLKAGDEIETTMEKGTIKSVVTKS
ncbi:exodeoxyribonuclease VII large subunit [Prevotella sp. Rep29]|uniref:exodeoxyribonuclease VII large subunit n=1 Tax=Prevotella sp. Rep29 TaxID=2691580 RepID=UPI001C6F2028|nr:exodeoxyribonuclease VII large subunit [Prevotella sp. Rep29]QYR10187.1 exodeoxyribonuclease VII large subunit [Prevotella sp. Rep29]